MTTITSNTGSPLQTAARPPAASTPAHENKIGMVTLGGAEKVMQASPTGKMQQAAKVVPSPEELQRITEELQRHISTLAPDLEFSVDESSGKSVMKFTDRTTKEVIRQFPSLEALEITKALDQFQRGLLINRKV